MVAAKERLSREWSFACSAVVMTVPPPVATTLVGGAATEQDWTEGVTVIGLGDVFVGGGLSPEIAVGSRRDRMSDRGR